MRRATVRASSADVSSQPCVATIPSRASIPTTIRSAPNRATAPRHDLRLPDRDRPQHNPRRAQRQGPRHVVHRADAAAELDREADRGPDFSETVGG